MLMKSEEAKYFLNIINEIQYEENAFTVWYGEDKIVLGAILFDSPEAQKFFSFATIYHTILDVDKKIKYSFKESIRWTDEITFEKWNPLYLPSANEQKALYYVENAVFRTEVLWDLLAQMFNIKENLGKPIEKVYAAQLFHDAQQGKRPNQFAKKVYNYMQQADNCDIEPWEGNYSYVREIRDKLTHRNSPSVSTMSNFDMSLRMPTVYVLKRVIEEYKQVSDFIKEYVTEVLKDYEELNNCTPENLGQEGNNV